MVRMVNSSSFDSLETRTANKREQFSQAVKRGDHRQTTGSPVEAEGACSRDEDNFLNQTHTNSENSNQQAIEPIASRTDLQSIITDDNKQNDKKSDAPSHINDVEKSSSVCCSVPLDRIKKVLQKIGNGTTESVSKSSDRLLCLYCNRTFITSNLREKHVDRFHLQRIRRRSSVRQQNRAVESVCLYCELFNEKSFSLKKLFVHLATVHKSKYFGCLACEIRFRSRVALDLHSVENHESDVVDVTSIDEGKGVDIFPTIEEQPLEVKSVSRNKKRPVISTKVASKFHNKRLTRQQAKMMNSSRKNKEQQLQPIVKNTKEVVMSKIKTKSSFSNQVRQYPNADFLFKYKKITDHSIDNLRIGSLTFEDVVFDKAFFNKVKLNIQENLLNYIDGKLLTTNISLENTISNFEVTSNVNQENLESSEHILFDMYLSSITPVTAILSSTLRDENELPSEKSKKKTNIKNDEVHYKYFTRRKYQAILSESRERRDLSKLDMWTQLTIKDRQSKIVNDQRTTKEKIEYTKSEEYRTKLQVEELDRILDKRAPFENLKEEALRTSVMQKLDGSHDEDYLQRYFDVQSVLLDILDKVHQEIETKNLTNCMFSAVKTNHASSSVKLTSNDEIPQYFNLQRNNNKTNSSGENSSDINTKDDDRSVELTGEWTRTKIYVCAACGLKIPSLKQLIDHKNLFHASVWCQHYEFVGSQSELYHHLSIPGLGKVGRVESSPDGGKIWRRSEARVCSKCGKRASCLGELHRHILECSGDETWANERKKNKYRYGSKSRRRRKGLLKLIRFEKKERKPSDKRKLRRRFSGPKSKPSDAESIERMLANLPPKRTVHKIISFKDGFTRKRNKKLSNDATILPKTKTLSSKSRNQKDTASNKEIEKIERNVSKQSQSSSSVVAVKTKTRCQQARKTLTNKKIRSVLGEQKTDNTNLACSKDIVIENKLDNGKSLINKNRKSKNSKTKVVSDKVAKKVLPVKNSGGEVVSGEENFKFKNCTKKTKAISTKKSVPNTGPGKVVNFGKKAQKNKLLLSPATLTITTNQSENSTEKKEPVKKEESRRSLINKMFPNTKRKNIYGNSLVPKRFKKSALDTVPKRNIAESLVKAQKKPQTTRATRRMIKKPGYDSNFIFGTSNQKSEPPTVLQDTVKDGNGVSVDIPNVEEKPIPQTVVSVDERPMSKVLFNAREDVANCVSVNVEREIKDELEMGPTEGDTAPTSAIDEIKDNNAGIEANISKKCGAMFNNFDPITLKETTNEENDFKAKLSVVDNVQPIDLSQNVKRAGKKKEKSINNCIALLKSKLKLEQCNADNTVSVFSNLSNVDQEKSKVLDNDYVKDKNDEITSFTEVDFKLEKKEPEIVTEKLNISTEQNQTVLDVLKPWENSTCGENETEKLNLNNTTTIDQQIDNVLNTEHTEEKQETTPVVEMNKKDRKIQRRSSRIKQSQNIDNEQVENANEKDLKSERCILYSCLEKSSDQGGNCKIPTENDLILPINSEISTEIKDEISLDKKEEEAFENNNPIDYSKSNDLVQNEGSSEVGENLDRKSLLDDGKIAEELSENNLLSDVTQARNETVKDVYVDKTLPISKKSKQRCKYNKKHLKELEARNFSKIKKNSVPKTKESSRKLTKISKRRKKNGLNDDLLVKLNCDNKNDYSVNILGELHTDLNNKLRNKNENYSSDDDVPIFDLINKKNEINKLTNADVKTHNESVTTEKSLSDSEDDLPLAILFNKFTKTSENEVISEINNTNENVSENLILTNCVEEEMEKSDIKMEIEEIKVEENDIFLEPKEIEADKENEEMYESSARPKSKFSKNKKRKRSEKTKIKISIINEETVDKNISHSETDNKTDHNRKMEENSKISISITSSNTLKPMHVQSETESDHSDIINSNQLKGEKRFPEILGNNFIESHTIDIKNENKRRYHSKCSRKNKKNNKEKTKTHVTISIEDTQYLNKIKICKKETRSDENPRITNNLQLDFSNFVSDNSSKNEFDVSPISSNLNSLDSENENLSELIDSIVNNSIEDEPTELVHENTQSDLKIISDECKNNTKFSCEICHKSFRRSSSLTKHCRSLGHIEKVSELEIEKKSKIDFSESIPQISAENDKENSELLGTTDLQFSNEKTYLEPIKLETNQNENIKSCLELNKNDYVSKEVLHSPKYEVKNEFPTEERRDPPPAPSIKCSIFLSANGNDFLRETLEKVSNFHHVNVEQPVELDKGNLETSKKKVDDKTSRKVLNHDEELFLECCSLLKSGSEISGATKTTNNTNSFLRKINFQSAPPDGTFLDTNITQNQLKTSEEVDVNKHENKIDSFNGSGSSFHENSNQYNNSNYLSSSNLATEISEEKVLLKKENCDNFLTNDEKIKNENHLQWDIDEDGDSDFRNEVISRFGNLMTKALRNRFKSVTNGTSKRKKHRSSFFNFSSMKNNTSETNEELKTSKKVLTKGAMKTFEQVEVNSLKFTDESSEKSFSGNSHLNNSNSFKRKSYDFQRSKDDLFNFDWHSDSYDVYEFEETQDFSMFNKNISSFRHLKNGKSNDVNVELSSTKIESDQSLNSVLNTKLKSNKTITKKKCKIMGKIFKNTCKSNTGSIKCISLTENTTDSVEDISEPFDYQPPVKDYTEKNHKMSPEEMNLLFDKLVGVDQIQTPTSQGKESENVQKGRKVQTKLKRKRKRRRTSENSTDEDFNINVGYKKKGKNVVGESGINLEQELKECIGVASRKSQRKCTSGKQNVLVEYWSSDDSMTESLIKKAMEISKSVETPEEITEQHQDLSENKNDVEKLECTDLTLTDNDKSENPFEIHTNSDSSIQPTREIDSFQSIPDDNKWNSSPFDKSNIDLSSEVPTTAKKHNKTQRNNSHVNTHKRKKFTKKLHDSKNVKKRIRLPESSETIAKTRQKRSIVDTLYYWSSSSEDEKEVVQGFGEREEHEYTTAERPLQHGWIVGDSPKKLVTMLAQAKGKKVESKCIKEQNRR